MHERSVRVVIHGRVQGVGYRDWVQRNAALRRLSGWVRNRRDGTVEAVFAGSDADVRAMIEACRAGPPAARVDRLEAFPGDMPDAPGFQVLPTA